MTAELLMAIAAFLFLGMSLAWWIQRRTGNSGWIDTVWAALTGLAAVSGLLMLPDSARRWMVMGLIVLWAVRLASHIGRRSGGITDDPRYADLMKRWGDRASFELFKFLQIQAAASFVLVVSILAAASGSGPLGLTDALAVMIAVVAIGGEALADHQLAAHRKSGAKGGVFDEGLWRYSRHPNYFFEWLFWCSWPVMALSGGWGLVTLSLLAPLMMYWVLVHASGIPPLEKHMLASRGDAFRRYQRQVNAFFPGPRKSLDG
ncbi:DUF1295 domain-containing protein [Asticcacaulis tiandongensis]|uniref:DUF1295 domain-containing protein n=1 Tax=Asticcacaulis tiandongensis TaxID=2565365 RepID=UPI00112D118B|nr:DUF1295 domain-containing protein [Asticcacaulis tiandongensis]